MGNQHTSPMPSADEIIGWLARYDATRLDEALAAMSEAFGRDMTYEQIRGVLRRAGRGTATSHMTGRRVERVADAVPRAPRVAPVSFAPSPHPAMRPPPPVPQSDDELDVSVTWDDPSAAQNDARRYVAPATDRAPAPAPAKRDDDTPRDAASILDRARADARERTLRAELKHMVQVAREAEARFAFADALRREPFVPRITARESAGGKREGALIVLASDWHVEETVDPQTVVGRNLYNMAVAETRARRFFDGILWLLDLYRNAYTMRDVVLWLGGDFISGHIHPELVESNECGPIDAARFAQRILGDGIASLLAHGNLASLTIPCSYGNHGRITEKRRIKTGAANSFEWMTYANLADRFGADPRVTFTLDRGAHQHVECFGRVLHFHHGDELKYQGGVGGLSVPLLRRIPAWNSHRRADIHHIGHFHVGRDFGEAVTNGSLIGPSAYGLSVGAFYEPPGQQSYVLDRERGKCLVTPIWVDPNLPAIADERAKEAA